MIKLIFKGDISAYELDQAIFPGESGTAISMSQGSPQIPRNDITVGKSGDNTWVKVDGIGKSEMSQATIDSIKSTVPTNHIRTEDV